ncbi:serine hydrolase domain-containing protein [Nocardioides limicola]|uniref:serine hydrolase domain-containing protein n=1 Tax=Nocardioides limicola TaxID=2803368 RepID=UPI00193B666C|nr:serine hydrolase domain-containing protein [Nocardioides sp. DJM-14]
MTDSVAPATARHLLTRLARVQRDGRLPSVVAGVVRDGQLVWCQGRGDVPGPVENTQYRIGSITKTVTAVLVLQLVEEGLVGLDQAIGTLIDGVPHGERTVRQLLCHDAGLPAEPAGAWWERSPGTDFATLIAANRDVQAAQSPGEQFHYSNLGYAMLGELVSRLRDQTWSDAAWHRVLEPLGMERTGSQPSGPYADGFSVHPYAGTLTREPATDTGAMAPAGQLWSTVADLTRWADFMIRGHRWVLPVEALDRAMAPRSGTGASGLTQAHALGFQLHAGGSGTIVGHSGSMPGFMAGCFVDRRRGTGVVLLSNGTTGLASAGTAIGLLDDLERHEPSIGPDWQPNLGVPGAFADLLGVWHWGNTAHTFELEGSQLVVRLRGEVVYRYVADGDGIVGAAGYQRGERLRVVRNEDGTINHLDLGTFVFTRIPYDPRAPIPGGPPSS